MPGFASMLLYMEILFTFQSYSCVAMQIFTSVYFCKINLWFVVFCLWYSAYGE